MLSKVLISLTNAVELLYVWSSIYYTYFESPYSKSLEPIEAWNKQTNKPKQTNKETNK